jgi:hypothetical protein
MADETQLMPSQRRGWLRNVFAPVTLVTSLVAVAVAVYFVLGSKSLIYRRPGSSSSLESGRLGPSGCRG